MLDLSLTLIQNEFAHISGANTTEPAEVSIKFAFAHLSCHYHHLVVSLTRSDPFCRELCLGSAREAILLLKDLVAHSEEVFNGIVWYVECYARVIPNKFCSGNSYTRLSFPSSYCSQKSLPIRCPKRPSVTCTYFGKRFSTFSNSRSSTLWR